MAMLEAMALGKPVVATAVDGVPEVVRHRVTGLLVEPGEEGALAEACLELARDREWAQRLGARARRVVQDEFSHERSGQALVDAYRRVAQTGHRLDVSAHAMSRPSITTLGFCSGLIRKLGEWGIRRVRHAIERRRMTRLRDNPTTVRMALRSARSLLIVCHGNIIRSPFAARLISQSLGQVARLSVTSAGLEAVPGRPPHPTALLTATARRIDLSRHTAALVEAERVTKSDAIFVMDIPQLLAMRQRFPDARDKIFLLTCLAPEAPLEIDDPVDGDEAVFQSCFEDISRATRPIVRILSDAMTVQ